MNKLLKNADSTGRIVSLLGYPKPLAKILQKRFGGNSFLIARWLKEYYNYLQSPNWWENLGRGFSSSFSDSRMKILISLLSRLEEGRESYLKYLVSKDMLDPSEMETYFWNPESQKIELEKEIEDVLFSDHFFSRDLTKKIMQNPSATQRYQDKTFKEASEDFGRRNLLELDKVILSYENGWRWIDAGKRNDMVAHDLANCGSSGLMSDDPDRTILALINDIGTVKLIVTWSPNQKRISSARDSGGSRESIKSMYHSYILDLMKKIGANYLPNSVQKEDVELCIRTISDGEPELLSESLFGNKYKFKTVDGENWIAIDNDSFLKENDYNKISFHLQEIGEFEKTKKEERKEKEMFDENKSLFQNFNITEKDFQEDQIKKEFNLINRFINSGYNLGWLDDNGIKVYKYKDLINLYKLKDKKSILISLYNILLKNGNKTEANFLLKII